MSLHAGCCLSAPTQCGRQSNRTGTAAGRREGRQGTVRRIARAGRQSAANRRTHGTAARLSGGREGPGLRQVIVVDILMDVYGADLKWAGWSIGIRAPCSRKTRRRNLRCWPRPPSKDANCNLKALSASTRDHRLRSQDRKLLFAKLPFGAHAVVRRWPILTRDATRYRGYFPTVDLVTP